MQNKAEDYVVAAGAVHDTHEDIKYTGVTKEMLLAEFGPEITELVMLVTEEDKSLPWKERKTKSLEKLMDSKRDHQMLICADKLSNGRSTLSNLKVEGDEYWKVFNAGKEDQSFYYYGVLKQLNKIRDLQMYWDYKEIVNELFVRH
jgi:(p)ppGpp synthase/HD superfamily hydrolase